MSIPETLRTLSQIEREWEDWHQRSLALHAEADALRERHEAAIAARFAELSDEDILDDESLRDWALRNETYHSGTYQRMRKLAEPTVPEVKIFGCDGREGQVHLLRPTVILERDSDIAVVTAELALWAITWLMGREDLSIDILESTLAAGGSYGIRWNPEAGHAVLHHTYRDEITSGSLHDVLSYVAAYHPYNNGRDLDDTDDWS